MPSGNLAKPKTVAAAIITGGISDAASTFSIHVTEWDADWHSPTIESTGGSDLLPNFANSGFLYCDYILRGWMVADENTGVEELVGANNPPAAITLTYASGRTQAFTTFVRRIRHRNRRVGPLIGVAIMGSMHNTTVADIEP